MDGKPFICLLATALLFCAIGRAQAQGQYYNDDFDTLPNGPIEIEFKTINFNSVTNQWSLSADAVNLTSQTYSDVKYLDEWVFDTTPAAFTYQGSGEWAGDGHTWSVVDPDGYLLASDVTPLPTFYSPIAFSAPPGFVAPTDLLPYTDVGTVGPDATVPFSFVVSVDSKYNFAFDSSFISTTMPVSPVPEPSTFVLLALGVAAIWAISYRRRGLVAD